MNFEGLTFDDVLLCPQRAVLKSRKDADISFKNLSIPIMSAPMPSVTSPQLASELIRLGGLPVIHRHQTIQEQCKQLVEVETKMRPACAIGIHDGIQRTADLYHDGLCTIFVIDVAHAHSDPVLDFVERWRQYFSDFYFTLVVGNIATAEAAVELVEAGADAIKVGIGPGSVCTTRQVTGFGVPQLQAIDEVATALSYSNYSGPKIPVIADGGIRNSGDIVKALAAGADVVMIGNLFAHANESNNNGEHYGCASNKINSNHAPEGIIKSIEIDDMEPLEDIVKRLTWGIKSGISYAGATNIRELQENAEWIRLTDAGRRESKYA